MTVEALTMTTLRRRTPLGLAPEVLIRLAASLGLAVLYAVAVVIGWEGVRLAVVPAAVYLGVALGGGWLISWLLDVWLMVGRDGLYLRERACLRFVSFDKIERVEKDPRGFTLYWRGRAPLRLRTKGRAESDGLTQEIEAGRAALG